MVSRLAGKELIERSLVDLLDKKSIIDITVREIAENCGISSRAFYNHFHDKNEVAGAVYIRYMTPHLNCRLDDWYAAMAQFFCEYTSFIENTLCYSGQNCISDTIIDMEWKKLRLHVKPEVYNDETEAMRTEIAIEYMLHGNIGSLRNTYLHKKHSALRNYMTRVFKDQWDYLSQNIPPLIFKNLSMDVVQSFDSNEQI